ncbi:hypothetical protein [Ekhidna sp.]|uniref:hypothetical protein n=1 Tax=Ekhidna sp. TaxID=2608089 RepID=UPI003C7D9D80
MRFKTLAIISLIFVSFYGHGQICKYVVNDKDPLTDDIIRTVKTRLTGPTPFYYIYYIRNGSDYKFSVEVGDYGELTDAIPKGSELAMRTGSGAVVRMSSLAESKPEIIDDFGSKITKYEIAFQMTEQTMKDIAETGIVFIRIKAMNNSFSDLEIPTGVVEISQQKAECIFK